ncbi:MAG TPA: hypothetical protein VLH94_03235 [Spirochaetia bacterium]|nr:hypothetical protein [Spirochaetia bacterium]
MYSEYQIEWIETGGNIANGGQLGKSELLAIYDNLQLDQIKPEYLPGENTILGKVSDRKNAMFELAEKLWGLSPAEWLEKEKSWLDLSRKIYPSQATEGKDKLDDVISPEILLRILATAKLVKESSDNEISDEAIFALNLVLSEVCAKGRTRLMKIDGKSIYGILRSNGVMIGTGGGKYLPLPTKSMADLFMMLHRDKINPDAYQK